MEWIERDDGWFTWFECPNCGAREFSRKPVCAECHIRLGKDEGSQSEAGNIANDISTERNVDEMSAPESPTARDVIEHILTESKAKIKIKEGTKHMKQENIYMLQYVAGALHGISTMMSETDKELKNVLFSLSEEVSDVVISETIDKEEETKSRVSIYMDDGGDDGK